MKEFSNRYIVKKGEDGIYEIITRNGDIEYYSDTEYCCYSSFLTRRGINSLKRKLPDYCTITQEGDTEIIFKFNKIYIDEICRIVKALRGFQNKYNPKKDA